MRCDVFHGARAKEVYIMGDKSPKATHKQAAQKQTKTDADKKVKATADAATVAAATARTTKK